MTSLIQQVWDLIEDSTDSYRFHFDDPKDAKAFVSKIDKFKCTSIKFDGDRWVDTTALKAHSPEVVDTAKEFKGKLVEQ